MTLKSMMLLVAALVLAPTPAVYAADADVEEKKPKKIKKTNEAKVQTKFANAMKIAAAYDEPVLALIYLDKDKRGDAIEKELFKWPFFAKEYARSNLVLFRMKLKSKDGKKIDARGSFKTEEEKRFIENHGLNKKLAALAKKDDKKISPMDVVNYPAIICVKGDAEHQQLLFRMAGYDRDGGPGVWLSTLDALLRTKNIEPIVSEKVQKILDDPTAFAGKKKR